MWLLLLLLLLQMKPMTTGEWDVRLPVHDNERPTPRAAAARSELQMRGLLLHTPHVAWSVCCPVQVNGTYLFTAHVLGQNGRDVSAWIMMNDRHRAPLHGDGRAGYGAGGQTVVLPLRRDDHVWLQLNKDSALLNDYTTFSGHLLFEDAPA